MGCRRSEANAELMRMNMTRWWACTALVPPYDGYERTPEVAVLLSYWLSTAISAQ